MVGRCAARSTRRFSGNRVKTALMSLALARSTCVRLFVEALAQADHRGGRRHVWHGAKSKPGSVVALMVEVAEEVPAGEHRLGERHHHTAKHEAALALPERRSGGIDRRRDPDQFVELGHQMQARSGSDPTVRCAQHHLALFLPYSVPDRCLSFGIMGFLSTTILPGEGHFVAYRSEE